VEEVCDEMERDLVLIGATGIEDKLQKGVPEAIQYLLDVRRAHPRRRRRLYDVPRLCATHQTDPPERVGLQAGMKVWVITGDKQETAINIAYSSRLLRSDMKLLKLNAESSDECLELLKKYLEKNKDAKQRDRDASGDEDDDKEHNEVRLHRARGVSLCVAVWLTTGCVCRVRVVCVVSQGKELACIVDGHTLKYALKDHPDEFVELTGRCHSVICCRTTPLQKVLLTHARTTQRTPTRRWADRE
jgi:magnesium-transporting ATPase (P-type)